MSGQAPTVSVVMAVYNEEKYVSMAIESILEQTFSDFEFLIVDDGSTDRTSEIVDGYAKSDNRVRLLTNKKNMGLPASLNKGIEAARGEYIARMDADDKSLPGRFERQVKYLDSNPETHVIGCQVRVIGANGEYFGYRRFSAGPRSPNEMKQTGPKVAHPSVMMRRSSVISVGKYRESFKYAQDLDLWCGCRGNLATLFYTSCRPSCLSTVSLRENTAGTKSDIFMHLLQVTSHLTINC